jgi:GNAT superfamily N-acetyltransferase
VNYKVLKPGLTKYPAKFSKQNFIVVTGQILVEIQDGAKLPTGPFRTFILGLIMISCRKIDFNNESEARLVVELLNVYAKDPMGGGEGLTEEVKQKLPSELRKRSTAHAFVAELDGVQAGVAICFEGFSTFECKPLLNVHDFCVIPSMRRKGVGAALIFAIEDYARSAGCCKITLEVLEGNHAAKATYKAMGFAAYELDPEVGQALFWQKKVY